MMGIFVVSISGMFTLSTGMSIENEIELYNKGEINDLDVMVANGVNKAREATYHYNATLIKIIK